MKIYGIAYHSPLDVVTLMPNTIQVTMQPLEKADVLFTRESTIDCESPVQLVFASPRSLVKCGIKIVDQGSRGQILNIKKVNWAKILNIVDAKEESNEIKEEEEVDHE